jgi:hypothetical protein
MDINKQREEISLIGRILSMEALLFVMGIASLVYGLINSEILNIAVGAGLVALIFLLMHRRRK